MKWQCALLQRWLPEYPDGDLSAFWKGRLQAHLEHCSGCRTDLSALREMEEALRTVTVTDPGQEFWNNFSREMHLKLVRADQAGEMAPMPRSAWWARLPYLVGAPALAGLLLWMAVGYLNPDRPGLAPAPQMSKSAPPGVTPPAAEMAKQKRVSPVAEKLAASPQALPPSDETKNFVYASKSHNGDELADDDLDDLESTLAGMTHEEREAFLKKLSQHEKDGSCLKRFSATALV
jgi:anti-sigma factor RsiW